MFNAKNYKNRKTQYKSNRKYKKTYKKYKSVPKYGIKSVPKSNNRSNYFNNELSGFDRSIYKTDKILNQIDHGLGVLSKPFKGILNIAQSLNPFQKYFKKS